MSRSAVLRLAAELCKRDHVIAGTGPLDVIEDDEASPGTITLDPGTGAGWVRLGKRQQGFAVFKSDKKADGAFLLLRSDTPSATAVAVELKSKLSLSELQKALAQLRQSTHRLRALAGALGAAIESYRWVLAFSDDAVENPERPDVVADRPAIDGGGLRAKPPATLVWRSGRAEEAFGAATIDKVGRTTTGDATLRL